MSTNNINTNIGKPGCIPPYPIGIEREEEKDMEYENRVQELVQLRMPELKEICRALNLTGWYKFNKIRLVHFIATQERNGLRGETEEKEGDA